MNQAAAKELWDAFIENVDADAGVKSTNLLGSVKKHKKMFMAAAKKLEA